MCITLIARADQILYDHPGRVMTPHMPNTPGHIVYSLGGLRDDSQVFRSYFGCGDFPEWPEIRTLLDPVPQ